MDTKLRTKFNLEFDQTNFDKFIAEINEENQNSLDFKVCETPLFLDKNLTRELIIASEEIAKIVQTEEFKKNSIHSIPEELYVPNEDQHPVFLQIDFGITLDENGSYLPQLIELQGFPSLYSYQAYLEKKVRKYFEIPENYTAYYNGYDFDSYVKLLKETIVGDCSSENVILLEIDPDLQKTRIDFYLTEKFTGIKSVCVQDIIKEDLILVLTKLFYMFVQ